MPSRIPNILIFWVKPCQCLIQPKMIVPNRLKSAIQGLRQLLATENPLKIMKNTFYFNLIALFTLKIFEFLS